MLPVCTIAGLTPLVSKQTNVTWSKIGQRFYSWLSAKHVLCFVASQPLFVCLGKGARVPDYFNNWLEIITAVPLTVRGMNWDPLSGTVCRMAGFLLLQNLHFHHPWWSERHSSVHGRQIYAPRQLLLHCPNKLHPCNDAISALPTSV